MNYLRRTFKVNARQLLTISAYGTHNLDQQGTINNYISVNNHRQERWISNLPDERSNLPEIRLDKASDTRAVASPRSPQPYNSLHPGAPSRLA